MAKGSDLKFSSSKHIFENFSKKEPFIRALPGYEKCQASDIILNFFIARTLTAGTVRMDGLFKQIAHREYFLDGIGKLRIAVWLVFSLVKQVKKIHHLSI